MKPLLHRCLSTGWWLSGLCTAYQFGGPWVHSRKVQCLACQFLSIVAQIFAFLVYWEGIEDHISLSALSVCSYRSVGTHMCRQKHAAACRSVPQHAAAQEIFPRDRTSLLEATSSPTGGPRDGRGYVATLFPPPPWGPQTVRVCRGQRLPPSPAPTPSPPLPKGPNGADQAFA